MGLGMNLKLLVPFMALYACPIYHPVPDPSPTPASTASETPQVTPSALPEPTPLPSIFPTPRVPGCQLGPSEAPQSGCVLNPSPGTAKYAEDVAEAQRIAMNNGFAGPNGYLGSEERQAAYMAEVVRILRSLDLCAIVGQEDEVFVKGSNDASYHYDIVRGDLGDRYTWDHLAAICKPSKF